MGASCGKQQRQNAVQSQSAPPLTGGGTTAALFSKFDRNGKGYISTSDLECLMKDDHTFQAGKDANHIMKKYGTNGQMSRENFSTWWNSTYTTYTDDGALGRIVDEVTMTDSALGAIPEKGVAVHRS